MTDHDHEQGASDALDAPEAPRTPLTLYAPAHKAHHITAAGRYYASVTDDGAVTPDSDSDADELRRAGYTDATPTRPRVDGADAELLATPFPVVAPALSGPAAPPWDTDSAPTADAPTPLSGSKDLSVPMTADAPATPPAATTGTGVVPSASPAATAQAAAAATAPTGLGTGDGPSVPVSAVTPTPTPDAGAMVPATPTNG